MITILLVVLGIIGLAACGNQTKKSTQKISVVSSLDLYAEPAQKILGKYGAVTSLINSTSIDPHDYTATTNDAKTTAQADVAIMNGAGYDAWLQKLVASNSNPPQLIDVAADVRHLPDGANEHLWYDFNTMIKVTNKLTTTFAKIKPSKKSYFTANGAAYIAEIKQLQKQEQQLKQTFSGKSVMITEPVFNYVLQNLNMKIVNENFAQDIDEGADPKPEDLQKMTQQLQNRQVAFLVVNRQVESSLISELVKTAKKAKVPIVYVTETKPKGKTYLTWMQSELNQLAKIAKGDQS